MSMFTEVARPHIDPAKADRATPPTSQDPAKGRDADARRRPRPSQPLIMAKRNAERFPEDFRFQLTAAEAAALNRSQSVPSSQKHRDPRFPPFAFTEHGAIMAATVLNSA